MSLVHLSIRSLWIVLLGSCARPDESEPARTDDTGPTDSAADSDDAHTDDSDADDTGADTGNACPPDTGELTIPPGFHFHYWLAGAPGDVRWITSTMADKIEPASWSEVGVLPLQWKWGYSAPWSTVEEWVAEWLDVEPGQAGILIDEFGQGGPEDELMGQALLDVRAKAPELFLAPYVGRVVGTDMTLGLQVADLVLVETYYTDWRAYYAMDERLQSALDAGLGDRSVAVLGMTGTAQTQHWVTTEKELRQQVAYLRAVHPEMPGLGLFGTMSPSMLQAVDRAIYDYFLGPAVRLTDVDGLGVENLGTRTAEAVDVVFEDAAGVEVDRAVVACLRPGATASVESAVPFATAEIAPAPDRYTVISWTDPTTLPPPDAAATADAEAWRANYAGPEIHPLAGQPDITLEVSSLGYVEWGTVEMAALEGATALSFTLTPEVIAPYGKVGVALVGEGEIGFSWYRGDDDLDLAPDSTRPFFAAADDQGWAVTETFAPAVESDGVYTFFASWDDATGTVRGLMMDESGVLLWDTGPLAVEGGMSFDRVRFYARPYSDESTIHYDDAGDPDDEAVFLLGGGDGYVLSAVVDDLVVRQP